jgi:hypothetical protein
LSGSSCFEERYAAKAKVALFKGGLILLAAVAVATQIIYKFIVPNPPIFEVMGAFSFLGFAGKLPLSFSAMAASPEC